MGEAGRGRITIYILQDIINVIKVYPWNYKREGGVRAKLNCKIELNCKTNFTQKAGEPLQRYSHKLEVVEVVLREKIDKSFLLTKQRNVTKAAFVGLPEN